jgi:hypothetical protein
MEEDKDELAGRNGECRQRYRAKAAPRLRHQVKRITMTRLTSTILAVTLVACTGCLGPKVQRPQSDVPIVHRIGWWAYQDGLSITNFTVEVVDAPLQLFNSKALLRMRVMGTIRFKNGGWRPFIGAVHVGERFDPASTNSVPLADFLVTPVVSVMQDRKYSGEELPFDLKVEIQCRTFGWMSNRYRIRCGGFTEYVALNQMK